MTEKHPSHNICRGQWGNGRQLDHGRGGKDGREGGLEPLEES